MSSNWLNVDASDGSESFSTIFWKRHSDELASGRFWADRIKTLRGEPAERLRLALQNLPLPAAFRESAIAVRALIRNCRKQSLPYEQHLALLYWLAAVSSFAIPYSERLQEPGINVLESVPGRVIFTLPFSYSELGYEKLELLNSSDVKLLKERWGEAAKHSTLHILHHDVWTEHENKLVSLRASEREEFVRSLSSMMRGGGI